MSDTPLLPIRAVAYLPLTPAPNHAWRADTARRVQMWERSRRCRAAGIPSDHEVAIAVAAFLANGGEVKRCATAHVLPIQNGVGTAANTWVA